MTVRDQKSFFLVNLKSGQMGSISEKKELEENSLMLTQCRKYIYPLVENNIK